MDEYEINPGPKKLLIKISKLNEAAKDKVDISIVEKAIYYAKKYHGKQMRDCGVLPYYTHPIGVAYMVADYVFKTDIIIASILHDTVEDTDLTKDMIASEFGEIVADHVEDLTRVKKDCKISSAEMLKSLWLQKKYDLLVVKICDRWHNAMTLGAKSSEQQKKTAIETITVYLLFAAYTGHFNIEQGLIKLCHRYLYVNQSPSTPYQGNDLTFWDNSQLLSLDF